MCIAASFNRVCAALTPPSSAKLSDFGFAQQISEAAEGAAACGEDGDGSGGASRVCGTANYIAPELLLNAGGGGGGAAAAADVWSLGCLMYALLFGQPPFHGRDTQQTFRRVARGMYATPVNTERKRLLSQQHFGNICSGIHCRGPYRLMPVMLFISYFR
jgi:serine/threonine protein kinase